MVNRVLPDEGFAAAAREYAHRVAAGPTVAHAATKRLVATAVREGARAADALVPEVSGALFATADLRGAVASFLTEGPGKATYSGGDRAYGGDPDGRKPGFAGPRARVDSAGPRFPEQEGRVEGSCPTPPQASRVPEAARPDGLGACRGAGRGLPHACPAPRRRPAPVRATITIPESVPMVALLGSGRRAAPPGRGRGRRRRPRARQRDLDDRPAGRQRVRRRRLRRADRAARHAAGSCAPDSVRRVIGMLRSGDSERPADVLSLDIICPPRPHDPAEDAEPEALRRRDRRSTRSSSASARPVPARPIWPWPRPCRRCRPSRSTGSS